MNGVTNIFTSLVLKDESFSNKVKFPSKLFVDVSEKCFTKKHLVTHQMLTVLEANPIRYDSPFSSVKYGGSTLMDMEDLRNAVDGVGIKSKHHGDQNVRVKSNPKTEQIQTRMDKDGIALSERPIAIRIKKLSNGSSIVEMIDGRTRLDILWRLGFKNVIVDVFECSDADCIRLGRVLNNESLPFGEGSVEDTEKALNRLIEYAKTGNEGLNISCGWDNVVTEKQKQEARELIQKESILLSNGTLKQQELDRVVTNVAEEHTGSSMCVRFPNGNKVVEYADEKLNISSNSDIVYKFMTGNNPGIILDTLVSWKPANPKQTLRIILYVGSPNPLQLEKSWKKGTFLAKNEFDSFEERVSKERYGSKPPNKSRATLHGAIAQIDSLEYQYPLDQLVVF